jgi:antitoxin component of RelBE/YafQ-DinJ toxin-antitoxin module
MRNVTVSARIPVEIHDQGNARLKRIGATPTQLINAAYSYVLKTGKLPELNASTGASTKASAAVPNQAQIDRLRALVNNTTLNLPEEYAALTAKEIKQMRLEERHGSPA